MFFLGITWKYIGKTFPKFGDNTQDKCGYKLWNWNRGMKINYMTYISHIYILKMFVIKSISYQNELYRVVSGCFCYTETDINKFTCAVNTSDANAPIQICRSWMGSFSRPLACIPNANAKCVCMYVEWVIGKQTESCAPLLHTQWLIHQWPHSTLLPAYPLQFVVQNFSAVWACIKTIQSDSYASDVTKMCLCLSRFLYLSWCWAM